MSRSIKKSQYQSTEGKTVTLYEGPRGYVTIIDGVIRGYTNEGVLDCVYQHLKYALIEIGPKRVRSTAKKVGMIALFVLGLSSCGRDSSQGNCAKNFAAAEQDIKQFTVNSSTRSDIEAKYGKSPNYYDHYPTPTSSESAESYYVNENGSASAACGTIVFVFNNGVLADIKEDKSF